MNLTELAPLLRHYYRDKHGSSELGHRYHSYVEQALAPGGSIDPLSDSLIDVVAPSNSTSHRGRIAR